MELVRKEYTYKDKEGKERKASNYYLLEGDLCIAIKPTFEKESKNWTLLYAISRKVN